MTGGEPDILGLGTVRVLVLAVAVLWAGEKITARLPVLRRYNIPIAVTGGLLCSLAVAGLDVFAAIEVRFDLSLRDDLLLVFFSTIGLSAKLRLLREGGRILARLAVGTLLFLVAQNAVGVALALLLGRPWPFGLIGGSISLAGGHGTAITWGSLAAERGYPEAMALGLAFATFGLICGGLVGGPIAAFLIRRDGLTGSGDAQATGPAGEPAEDRRFAVTSRAAIRTLLLLAVCIGVGAELNRWLGGAGYVLPGFLTAMAVGVLLTNAADATGSPLDGEVLDLFNDVSLHLFLAMSLMSMQLTQLSGALGSVFVVLVGQMALTAAFVVAVVYRLCGRGYDGAVMAAGFAGLGMGATPVGVANMNAVTSRFGASPKAFIVIPLVGAFLLDITNAFVIQSYITLLR